jgi:integrase
MSLEFRKTSKWWYGVFTVNGQRQVLNLGVKITGQRPAKRTQQGDDAFERSRGRALAAYEQRQKELEDDRTEGRILERLVEIKTGTPVTFPKLADLPNLWAGIPRRKEPNPKHVAHCRTVMRRFADFATQRQNGVSEFVEVKPETAAAFMAAEEARGLTPKTWNDTLKLLRSTFQHLHPDLPAGKNPFRGLITKASETVSRQPFSVEELKAIQDACLQDRQIGPVILTGMCTAMRLGDCCRLKWPDVDLKEGFITVKTSKTGERVDIPIFPLLREELERTPRRGKSDLCFPQQADIYGRDSSGMSKRVQKFLAKALDPQPEAGLPELPPTELRQRATAYLDTRPPGEKTDKMRQVIDLYLQGANIDAVTEAAGCSVLLRQACVRARTGTA